MIAALIVAAAAAVPLGVWPQDTGRPANVVQDVEFYLIEPEDDYSIVAVQPLTRSLTKADPAEVKRLAELAKRLGADAVLLLGELAEKAIPPNPDTPLPSSGRYSIAVFLSFDQAEGWESKPPVPSALGLRHPARHGPRRARPAIREVLDPGPR